MRKNRQHGAVANFKVEAEVLEKLARETHKVCRWIFTHREDYKDLGVCICCCFKSWCKSRRCGSTWLAGVTNKGTLRQAVSECDVIYSPAQEMPQYDEIVHHGGFVSCVCSSYIIVLPSEPLVSHSGNIRDHWSQHQIQWESVEFCKNFMWPVKWANVGKVAPVSLFNARLPQILNF